jgi:hypothetical protein
MSSNSSSYGQASTTTIPIHTNWEAGVFVFDNTGCVVGANSLLTPYQGLPTSLGFYTITRTGRKKVSGFYIPNNGNANRVFLGIFDSDGELQSAAAAVKGAPITSDDTLEGYYRSYGYDIVDITQTNLSFTSTGDTVSAVKPCYLDLVNGYYLDTKTFAEIKPIVPTESKEIIIGYYRKNPYESIGIPSIDWMHYRVELVKDIPVILPIISPVLGGLYISDTGIKSQLNGLPTIANHRPFSDYFPESVSNIFNEWNSLYQIAMSQPLAVGAGTLLGTTSTTETSNFCLLAATNNYWDNGTVLSNIGFDANHPMFAVDDRRAYDWHIKPQSDGSFGDLVMNSPLLEDIAKALDVAKWSVNLDDPDLPRVDNLGWRIERTNQVLGIRVKPDGTIDETLEKKENRREHAEGNQRNDPQEYNPNCFGSKGLLVRYLPNKFKPKGKDMETIEGGFRKVKDIPQLLAELHEQANAAMGYQEGTAIEINVDDETYRHPNQLALLIEIFVMLKQSGAYSKGAFFSSVVAEQSIKEVIGGLGLRTVDKYLEFKIAGKTAKLYYKGISASQSIRRKLSAISTNIGTIIGNIT